MNKLKILKSNLSSTAILSFAMFICILCTMLILPIGIEQLIGYEKNEDLELFSEEIADYCLINFPNMFYKDLKETFDMENYAGIAHAGYFDDGSGNSYSLNIVSEKMLYALPNCGYEFTIPRPQGNYREAFAPYNYKKLYEIGDIVKVTCNKGVYEYTRDLKIIGFTDKEYYHFSYHSAELSDNISHGFLIYDDIPDYANVTNGLMISYFSADYYKSLGAEAQTVRTLNESGKYTYSNDSVLYWSGSLFVLLIIALAANYYFSVDKMTKRSGIMIIYGAKWSDIVVTELIKLLVIFAVTFAASLFCASIMIATTENTLSWVSYFIGVGISAVLYLFSTAFGFIKFVKFEPLKALSANNIE